MTRNLENSQLELEICQKAAPVSESQGRTSLNEPQQLYQDLEVDISPNQNLVTMMEPISSNISRIDVQRRRQSSTVSEYEDIESQDILYTLSMTQILLLTCNAFGSQFFWSVLMLNCTPYLLSIGLSKSKTALVLLAGPICGVIVQPLVGAHSDSSRWSFGRRKPYIIFGAIWTVFSFLVLAWTQDVLSKVLPIMKFTDNGIQSAILTAAIFWLWMVNISIQFVQFGTRALIADSCSPSQQVQATAWSSRLGALGGIAGNLTSLIGSISQSPFALLSGFKRAVVVSSMALSITVSITCICIAEKSPHDFYIHQKQSVLKRLISELFQSFKTMSKSNRKIFQVQFFSWMGWFPFLYYNSTYISGLDSSTHSSTKVSQSSQLMSTSETSFSINHGARASLTFAIMALISSFTIPMLLHWIDVFDICFWSSKRPYLSTSGTVDKQTLVFGWAFAHLLFSTCMFSTAYIKTWTSGLVLMGINGISWAMITWIPMALINADIAESRKTINNRFVVHHPAKKDHSGAIIGLHNVAIALPQIISAFGCSSILHLTQIFDLDSFGTILRVAGVSSLVAAYLSDSLLH